MGLGDICSMASTASQGAWLCRSNTAVGAGLSPSSSPTCEGYNVPNTVVSPSG